MRLTPSSPYPYPGKTMPEDAYFPPSEEDGGWRRMTDPQDIRRRANMIPEKLDEFVAWMRAIPGRLNAGLVVRGGALSLKSHEKRSTDCL